MASLTISLPKPLREFVDDQVSSGTYGNPSAFIAALVKAERKRKAEEKLLALVREAEESGPATPWTAADAEYVRREVRKRLEAERKHHAKTRKKTGSAK